MFDLREYQKDGVRDIRAAFRNHDRVLYVLPTGGGKTVSFAYITASAAAKGNRTCILVHRVELVRQVAAALREFGVPFGIIAPQYERTDDMVQIAMVQTLVRRVRNYDFDFIVCDECQHACAQSYLKIINSYIGAKVLGVTATPCRLGRSDKGLGDIFERMVIGPSPAELIMQGYLSPYKLYSTNSLDRAQFNVTRGDFDHVQVDTAMRKRQIVGSLLEHYRDLCGGAPAIAFFSSVAAAYEGADMFRSGNYTAAVIEGAQNDKDRAGVVRAFRENRLQVLCTCDVVSEGFDVPGVVCGLYARPTKSLGLCLQQWGRALRPLAGKKEAILLDHVGNYEDHGLPDDDRQWTLEFGAAKAERKDKLVACPSCSVVGPARGRCANCGYVWPVKEVNRTTEVVDGRLVEITADMRAEKKRAIGEAIRAARGLGDMHVIAKQYGYSPGWAWARWGIEQKRRRKFGKQTVIEEEQGERVYG